MTSDLTEVAEAICRSAGLVLEDQVGSGSFKVTFRARNSAGSIVALKVFKQGGPDQRTDREIEAMRRCQHPSIATLHSVDTVEVGGAEHLYLLEEYFSGGTLSERIKGNVLSREDVLTVGASLIDAISYLRTLDLVHRDIKPDNIMFKASTADSAVLVDFGVVRDLAAGSLTPTWLAGGPGTPLFASPEQLRNEKALIGWCSDQFAVGVVLAISATGVHPFGSISGSTADIVARVAARRPIMAAAESQLRALGLEPVTRMLDPWPIRRYKTPDEMRQAWAGLR